MGKIFVAILAGVSFKLGAPIAMEQLASSNVIVVLLYLYIYIALLAVHTNQNRFECERPREIRAPGL